MRLRLIVGEIDRQLVELDNDDVDCLMDSLLDGSADIGPSGGYASSTTGQYESALKAFYRFHGGHDVDPGDPFAPSERLAIRKLSGIVNAAKVVSPPLQR